MIVTLVLAAGEGSRLGGPKALVAWPRGEGEVPLAIAHARARLESESDRVVVVARAEVVSLLARFGSAGLDLVVSNAPDSLGAAGSISMALPFVNAADSIVITPVDTPPAHPQTVRLLLDALGADSKTQAARPVYEGRGGHPVALRCNVLGRYAEPFPPTLREHLRSLGAACVSVECTDPTVRVNLNDAHDVWGALRHSPKFIH